MNERYSLSRPDFVIAGWPDGKGRCIVLGSHKLTEADLRVEWREMRMRFGPTGLLSDDYRSEAVLQTAMQDYVIAEGDTYTEALSNLFSSNQWNPEPEPTRVEGWDADQIILDEPWPKELPE